MSCRTMRCTPLFILLILMLSAATASAAGFRVHPILASGFHEGAGPTVTNMLKTEIANQPGAQVLPDSDIFCTNEACAQADREESGADAVIVGSIDKLGSKAIMLVQAIWADQTLRYNVSLVDLGELDRLAPRLASAIVNRTTFEQAMTVETVTEKEEKTYKKIAGDFTFGPAMGVMVPVADSYVGAGTLFGFSLPLRYEMTQFAFGFEPGVYFDGNPEEGQSTVEWLMDATVIYYIFDGWHSPMVGGMFGLHSITINRELTEEQTEQQEEDIFKGRIKAVATGDNDYLVDPEPQYYSGWAASASAFTGYELFRTYTAHVAFRLGYKYTFIELDGEYAHGPFFDLALTF
jgi:hypothetical protein